MGLRFAIDIIADLGYPEATEELGIEIDYSEGLDAFVETFYDEATSLVPVDTGYLMSTIGAENDGYSFIECYAEAHYAQYVEFGTWKMEAQPYFMPALEAAFNEAIPLFQEAIQEAQQEEREILEEMGEQEAESFSSPGMGVGGFGGIFSSLFLIAFYAVALFAIDEFFNLIDPRDSTSGYGSVGSIVDDFLEID